jgi:transmembrane sensor
MARQRAEKLLTKLGGLPPELAMPVLARRKTPARRAAIMRIAALLAAVPVGWAGWRYAQAQPWSADMHTAAGERRVLKLADGTSVTLNTSSAIDVRFSAAERLIVLRSGEILVSSGHDTAGRPLRVTTAEGILQPLGTRFNVRRRACSTELAVLEGAVQVTSAGIVDDPVVVTAGNQTRFNKSYIAPQRALDPALTAWTSGMLLADQMRLDELAAELTRYRDGIVRVDPAVAGLRISGAFPIADTERTLDMLVSTYPVDSYARLHGYWITLAPRP